MEANNLCPTILLINCWGFFSLLGVLQWGASKTLAFHFKTFHVFLLEDKDVSESFLFMKESLTYFFETNSGCYIFWLICHQNSAVWYQKIIEGKKKEIKAINQLKKNILGQEYKVPMHSVDDHLLNYISIFRKAEISFCGWRFTEQYNLVV